MRLVFEQIRTGGDRNFGYLLGDRDAGLAILIDPSFSPDTLVERATAQGLEVKLVINTHGHGDHTNGNSRAVKLTGAKLAAHPGVPFALDVPLEDGRVFELGSLRLKILHVPGHTPDHIIVHLAGERVALTGDHLFVGKIGGTSTEADSRTEYESLERTLRELPDDTTIWPGHDYGARPSSTILLEKATNPFLRAAGIQEFLELKRTWADFKARYGLR
jgi:glyoxylase-like metal-dependent hydrolase (beta-lactamase superfamily II)